MRALVIGAGVGGLCAAIRLAAAGHDVTVFERNPVVGGKLATLEEGGYTFDLGPTLLTLPQYFDEVFRLAGTSLATEVELIRLDPQFRYRWPDGATFELPDAASAVGAVEAFSPGQGEPWARFESATEQIWDVAERSFLVGPMSSAVSVPGRMRSRLGIGRLDGRRTLSKMASSYFDDLRLRQLVGRYATYSGSSPYLAPATASFVSHVERAFGCWHVRGGLGRLRDALELDAARIGVDIRLGADVGRITTDRHGVTGLDLADGGHESGEVVVSNVDAAHLYTDLLPDPKRANQLDEAGRSMSAFLICAAVRGRTDGIAHHNVFFSLHDEQEFRYLTAGQFPIDPTVQACVSSVTDPGMAPSDGENWVILVNAPAATGVDRKLMTAAVLNRLAERGADIRDRILFTRTLVPADFDARYRADGGAIYGTSSNGKQAAFARPNNVGPVHGLYLVGGSTHPGGGLPMVATSARIVADLVADRHG